MPLNWGVAEILAYASLLDDGSFVRITGEDVGRYILAPSCQIT